MHCVIMTHRTWLSPNPANARFKIFNKIDIFQKIFWISLGWKKANSIFEEQSNLYLIVLLISFFPLLLWITAENRTTWRWFTWTTKLGGAQHHKQVAPDYSSATAIMLVMLWTEHDFSLISECKNSFNNKLKNLQTS